MGFYVLPPLASCLSLSLVRVERATFFAGEQAKRQGGVYYSRVLFSLVVVGESAAVDVFKYST